MIRMSKKGIEITLKIEPDGQTGTDSQSRRLGESGWTSPAILFFNMLNRMI
jgi:hypothetical protein